MNQNSSANGLYGKVLEKGGVIGLLLFMTVGFLMYVTYNGQQKIIEKLDVQTEILKDIRYLVGANRNLTAWKATLASVNIPSTR